MAIGTVHVHRTKCQALTIALLTRSPYTTKIARIRCYTMLSTIVNCRDVQHCAYIKCQDDVQHTISAFIKCQEVQTHNKCVH